MLNNSFILAPGIGVATEKLTWQSGLLSWDQIGPPYPHSISRSTITLLERFLEHFYH